MPSYFPENNVPKPDDTEVRSLQKINDLLQDGITVVVGEVEVKNDSGNPLWVTDGGNSLTVDGTVTALEGGETPTSGFATLTNDTRWELNTEGFATVAIELVSSGVAWGANGVVAQAYNGAAPANNDLFAPAGIRYRHASDTSAVPLTALNNIYWNLNIGPTVGNGFGTNLTRIDGSNGGSLVLPATGPRYFLFDLTTSRFALRPFFTSGSVAVSYRLYKGRHPYFSARNVIIKGEAANGSVAINGTVTVAGGSVDASGSTVYVDGGYLDAGFIENEILGGLNNYAANYNDALPVHVLSSVDSGGASSQSNFSSTSSGQIASVSGTRKLLSIYNEGPGTLNVLYGGGTASATDYSVKLLTGDYLEITKYHGQVNGIFLSAGTAKVTEITI